MLQGGVAQNPTHAWEEVFGLNQKISVWGWIISTNNLSWKRSHSLRLPVCPGTLLWFLVLLFLWGKCKFDVITFLSSLDLRFLLIETSEDWSPAGFIKPQKTHLKLNSATLQDSSSLNLIALMVIDSLSSSASRIFCISASNICAEWKRKRWRETDGREKLGLILFAPQISVSESPALPSRLITSSPMKLVTMTEWLPALYKKREKYSCFPDEKEKLNYVNVSPV